MSDILTGNGVMADYITFPNAQRKSGMSRNHFRQLVRDRGLKTYRVSERVLLLRLDEVQALLEGACVPVTAQTA